MNIPDSYFWNWLLDANKKKWLNQLYTYILYLFILVYLFILFIYKTSLDAYYRSPQGASAGYLYGYHPYAYRGYYYG